MTELAIIMMVLGAFTLGLAIWNFYRCDHDYEIKSTNGGHYDYEVWYECTKCGKQLDIPYD